MSVNTYDSRCHDLAKIFLSDNEHLNTTENRHELAIAIQEAIEVWFEMQLDEESRT